MSTARVNNSEGRQERRYAFWVLVWGIIGALAASIFFLFLHFHIFYR